MNAENRKSLNQSVFAAIYLIFALLIFPAFGLNEGLKYFNQENLLIAVKEAGARLSEISASLQFHQKEEEFWVGQFSEAFAGSDSPESFLLQVEAFCNSYDFPCDIIVFKDSGAHVADNFTDKVDDPDAWKNAGLYLGRVLGLPNSLQRMDDIDRLRPLLGKSFYTGVNVDNAGHSIGQFFHPTDFANDRFRFWFARKPGIIALVRVDRLAFQHRIGLRHFARKMKGSDARFAEFSRGQLIKTEFSAVEAKAAFSSLLRNPGDDFFQANKFLYTLVKLAKNDQVLLRVPVKVSFIPSGKLTVSVFMSLLFILLLLIRSRVLPDKIEDFSVFMQMFVLIGISTGIPLLILTFFAISYFHNKQSGMIQDKNRQMINFISEIDRNFDTEMARMNRYYYKSIENLKSSFNHDSPAPGLEKFGKELYRFALSSSLYFKGQVFDLRQKLLQHPAFAKIEAFPRKGKNKNNNSEAAVEVIARYHLECLNESAHKEASLEKTLLLEMFFQKPLNLIVHDFIKIEGIVSEIPWGSSVEITFMQPLKLLSESLYDSYLAITSGSDFVAHQFNQRILDRIIRNPFNFKTFVIGDRNLLLNEQRSVHYFPEIAALLSKISDFPYPEPILINYSGQPHIFVGLNSKRMRHFRYCLLYDLEPISAAIRQEARDLVSIALFALLLVFFMFLTLYLNLLWPVKRLHQAADALARRDSTFRLPVTGSDEFADMARIFNTGIGEFEELQIAGIVQKRLLPNKPLLVEGFSIFGKSLPMAFMGGDYFDCFKIDENRFVMLLGDVAGHGVGAAIIMAIAKAGVICAEAVADDPAEVLRGLHQIILGTKNRLQRKVMTFQYLLVDRRDNKMLYANAGACSPVIIDSGTGTIRVIDHPGAVLGGFKKNVYHNTELSIRPGQAIVFYTDGMVEARNETGTELGYDGLYEIFLKAYDSDAEKYYQNISQKFHEWLGSCNPGDDLTVVLAVCERNSA